MKITKRQLQQIIKEEKAKILKEQDVNPLPPSQVTTMIEEAILETVYDIVAENDLSDGMQVPDETVHAIADGLRRAANTFTKEQGL